MVCDLSIACFTSQCHGNLAVGNNVGSNLLNQQKSFVCVYTGCSAHSTTVTVLNAYCLLSKQMPVLKQSIVILTYSQTEVIL